MKKVRCEDFKQSQRNSKFIKTFLTTSHFFTIFFFNLDKISGSLQKKIPFTSMICTAIA